MHLRQGHRCNMSISVLQLLFDFLVLLNTIENASVIPTAYLPGKVASCESKLAVASGQLHSIKLTKFVVVAQGVRAVFVSVCIRGRESEATSLRIKVFVKESEFSRIKFLHQEGESAHHRGEVRIVTKTRLYEAL